MNDAQQAFRDGPGDHWGKPKSPKAALSEEDLAAFGSPQPQSLCVDAACNGQPGDMEYQGVWLHDQSLAFAQGPYPLATNNIGEFLALVHGLAVLREKGLDWPIYSDSRTAIGWVQRRRANSKVQRDGKTSQRVNRLVARAEKWLESNEYRNPLLKWETKAWGEIPADFGRK